MNTFIFPFVSAHISLYLQTASLLQWLTLISSWWDMESPRSHSSECLWVRAFAQGFRWGAKTHARQKWLRLLTEGAVWWLLGAVPLAPPSVPWWTVLSNCEPEVAFFLLRLLSSVGYFIIAARKVTQRRSHCPFPAVVLIYPRRWALSHYRDTVPQVPDFLWGLPFGPDPGRLAICYG